MANVYSKRRISGFEKTVDSAPQARSRPSRRRLALYAISGAALSVSALDVSSSQAAVTSTWTNTSGSFLWSNPLNWSPNTYYPSNGNGGVSDFNVVVGPPATTSLDVNVSIDSLTVNAGGAISIQGGKILSINGPTLTDAGSIQINTNSGANSFLNFNSSTSVSGSGSINLDGAGSLAQLNTSAGATVTQAAAHSITGFGTVNAALINNGTVNASTYGQALNLQTSNMTNNALFEATGNGTLAIGAINLTQGAGGQITNGGGAVSINGASINGGTLNASGGSFTLSSATLTNVTVASGGTVALTAGTTVNVAGTTLTNNGTIQVDTNTSNANLNFTSNVSVGGTGTIFLYDNNPHPTLNSSNGATVTFGAGQLVDGEGIVNASLVNNGTINANVYGQALTLATNSMVNNNIFEATSNGTLSITGINITQGVNGVIKSDGSAVSISGSNISGGTLTTPAGSVIGVSNSTLTNVNISTGTTVLVLPSTNLNIAGTLNNNGLIQVDNNGGNANLNFNNSITITGTGAIYLFDNNPRPTMNTSAGAIVTLSAGQTVYGEGIVNAALINNGVVNANTYGQTLTLQSNAMSNNNLFEATNNGSLVISGINVTQAVGAQITSNGGTVSITGSTITGGTLNASTGIPIYLTSTTLSGISIYNGSSIILTAGTNVNISGPLVNNGTIQIDTNASNANLNFLTNSTVTGTGRIYLFDNNPSPTLNTSAGVVVTFSAGQTIDGDGIVNAALINNGTINADIYGQSLTLQTSAMTNNHVFEATNNSGLGINGINVNNSAGLITSDGSGRVTIYNGANITGGVFSETNGGSISTSTATFTNVNISTGTTVVVLAGTTLSIAGGSLLNNGTIQVDQNASNANLLFTSSTNVTGTGGIFLDDYNPRATINASAGATVTFGSGQTITGTGNINAALVNNGIINANIYGQSLILQTNAMTNNNLIEATNNSTLYISGIALTQAPAGLIKADTGGVLINNGATISSGTIASTQYNVTTSTATFNNVNIATGSTVIVAAGTVLNITGTSLNNNGTIQVDQVASNANLSFGSNVTVSGTGTIVLDDYNPNARLSVVPGLTVTLGAGQLVDGVGEIDGTVINNGTFNANSYGHSIVLNGSISGNGTFGASNNGTLVVANLLSVSSSGQLSGTSGSSTILINAGALLTDSGTETGLPNITDNGTFTITAKAGTGITTHNLFALSLGSTGLATVAPTTTSRTLLITSQLNFSGYTNNWTGKLNLANNDMTITAGNLGDISNQLLEGSNGGAWNGAGGITSSKAASDVTHLTALGAIQNNQDGPTLFTAAHPFDGTTPAAAAILIKYTYYGDANLDGKVDGSDYSLIDNGYASHLAGWYNGDFNYDGVVNGTDYTLIDNVFNTQGTQFSASVASQVGNASSAVPEPAAIAVIGAMLLPLLSRRRRNAVAL